MSLNERIAKVIEYSGLTSSEFADEIDVQRSSISHVTSGRNKPSLEFIIKIKSRFPEILWDWLVTGDGEMLKSELSEEDTANLEENSRPTSLPDLFTLISGDEEEEIPVKEIPLPKEDFTPFSESPVAHQSKAEEKIIDSQRLENPNQNFAKQFVGNQQDKIKRIVIFYENGKFESFEP